MKHKTAILITTFLRDSLLCESVQSIVDNWQENFIILIGDQGRPSEEKAKWALSMKEKLDDNFHYREFPFNSGLSYGRNRLVELAKEKKCDYVILASDSFKFNETLKNIEQIIEIIKDEHFDIIGGNLWNSICNWEGKLNLIEDQSFEIDFVDKTKSHYIGFYPMNIWDCEIMRNFFVAKIDVLLQTKWDENLKMGEHEDEFYRLKLQEVKCGWTDYIYIEKMNDRSEEYAKFRKLNFNDGLKKVRDKHSIKNWVTYKHHEFCHQNLTKHKMMCYN